MCTLTDLSNSEIISRIKENMALFYTFDGVYLFGSVLDGNKYPNDVDLLLIYSECPYRLIEEIKHITNSLKDLLHISVDLTVLSEEEERDTQFLHRVSSQLLRLK